MAKLSLNKEDLNSACWQKISRYLKEEQRELRERNDADLSDTKTANLRGQIELTKKILQVESSAPEIRPVSHQ